MRSNWKNGVKLTSQLPEFQPKKPSTEIFLSNIPSQIALAGQMEILQDPETWICDTGASNHLTLLQTGCLVNQPSEIISQGISGPARKAECKVDIPSTVCDDLGFFCQGEHYWGLLQRRQQLQPIWCCRVLARWTEVERGRQQRCSDQGWSEN